jgi:hypothetical protein
MRRANPLRHGCELTNPRQQLITVKEIKPVVVQPGLFECCLFRIMSPWWWLKPRLPIDLRWCTRNGNGSMS